MKKIKSLNFFIFKILDRNKPLQSVKVRKTEET